MTETSRAFAAIRKNYISSISVTCLSEIEVDNRRRGGKQTILIVRVTGKDIGDQPVDFTEAWQWRPCLPNGERCDA